MSWQIWVLLSGIVTGLAQSVGKNQIHKISALQMGVLRDVSGWIVAVVVWRALGTGWEGWSSVIAMGNGAIVALGTALYFIATRSNFTGSSVFGYLLSQVMIVVSSAIIFSEWVYFDPSTMLGIGNLSALVLTMAAMLLYVNSLKLGRKWIGLLVASALINVVGNLVAKYYVGGAMNVWNYFFAEQTGLMICGIVILYLRGQSLQVGSKNWRIGMVQGILSIIGPAIYLNMLVSAPLSIASLIRRIAAILVTVVSGLWWYQEGGVLTARAWISLALAILAFGIVMGVNTPSS